MKKYIKEIVFLICQTVLFYVFPLFMDLLNPFGMVLLMLMATFVFSVVLGSVSGNKLKLLCPLVIAVIFIPSVFIFYNETALIHALWYFVVSMTGLGLGMLIRVIIKALSRS